MPLRSPSLPHYTEEKCICLRHLVVLIPPSDHGAGISARSLVSCVNKSFPLSTTSTLSTQLDKLLLRRQTSSREHPGSVRLSVLLFSPVSPHLSRPLVHRADARADETLEFTLPTCEPTPRRRSLLPAFIKRRVKSFARAG